MSEPRKKMLKALMNEIVPELRRRGFEGTFPNLKRKSNRAQHLFTVRFDRHGKSFVVEVAVAPLNGITYKTGWQVRPDEVTVAHTARRLRLGAANDSQDNRFTLETSCVSPFSDPYASVAKSIIPLIATQAEPWWIEAEEKLAP